MTTAQKLASLRKRLTSRKKMLEKNDAKVAEYKARGKSLRKEIDGIADEISQLEMKVLSETLTTSGITAADVQEAIAAGIIKPSTVANKETDGVTYNTEADSTSNTSPNDGVTYNTADNSNSIDKEDTNEISDS